MTERQLKCIKEVQVDHSLCSSKCTGMDIISYDTMDVDKKILKQVRKLSEKYNAVKYQKFDLPTKFKGIVYITIHKSYD